MSWLTYWNRRKLITVNGSTSGTQSDYQMKLTINQSAGTINLGGNILATFNDLRFTKSDGTTLLNYWIESITGTSPNQIVTVWIKLAPSPDTIPVSPGTYSFYIYYDNSGASSGNNGTNTFDFFDHFSGSSIDTSKWVFEAGPGTIYGAGSCTVANSIVTVAAGTNTYWFLRAINVAKMSIPFAIRYYAKFRTPSTNAQESIGVADFTSVWGSNAAHIYWDVDNRKAQVTKANNVSTDHAITTDLTAWRIFDLGVRSGAVDFYENGSLTYTKTDNIPNVAMGASINLAQPSGIVDIDYILIRKYVFPEPTFSTVGTEELGVTATLMTISQSENPCRTGICTITATVTWQNLGNSSVTFRPTILIDGVTYVQTASDTTIVEAYPATSSPIQITTPTLPVGTHSICPYPN